MSSYEGNDVTHHHDSRREPFPTEGLITDPYTSINPLHPLIPPQTDHFSGPDSPSGVSPSPYSASSISTPIILSHTSPPPSSLYISSTPPLLPSVAPDIPTISVSYQPSQPDPITPATGAFTIHPSTPNPSLLPPNSTPSLPNTNLRQGAVSHSTAFSHSPAPLTSLLAPLPGTSITPLSSNIMSQHPSDHSSMYFPGNPISGHQIQSPTPASSTAFLSPPHHMAEQGKQHIDSSRYNVVHHHESVPQHIAHAMQKRIMVNDQDVLTTSFPLESIARPPTHTLPTHPLPKQTPAPVHATLNAETVPHLQQLLQHPGDVHERDHTRHEFNKRILEQKYVHLQHQHAGPGASVVSDRHHPHAKPDSAGTDPLPFSTTSSNDTPHQRLPPKVFDARIKQPFAIHDACEIGDIAFLNTLFTYTETGERNDIWKNIDFNQRDIDNLTPIHICILNGRLKCLQLLLKYGNVDLSVRTEGVPLLMFLLTVIGAFPVQFHQFGRDALQLLMDHHTSLDLFKFDDLKQGIFHVCAQYDLDYFAIFLLHEIHRRYHSQHVEWLWSHRITGYALLPLDGFLEAKYQEFLKTAKNQHEPHAVAASTTSATPPATAAVEGTTVLNATEEMGEGEPTPVTTTTPEVTNQDPTSMVDDMVVPKNARLLELLLKQDNMKRTPLHIAAQCRSYRVLRVFTTYILHYYPLLPLYMRKMMRLACESGDHYTTPASLFADKYNRTPLHYVYYYGQSVYPSLSQYLSDDPCAHYLHEVENAVRTGGGFNLTMPLEHITHAPSDTSFTFPHLIPISSEFALNKPASESALVINASADMTRPSIDVDPRSTPTAPGGDNSAGSSSHWRHFSYIEVFNLIFGSQSSLDAHNRTPPQLAMLNASQQASSQSMTMTTTSDVQPPTLISWSPRCFEHHTASRITRKDPYPPPENVRRLQVLLNFANGAIRSNEFNHNYEQLGCKYLTHLSQDANEMSPVDDPFLSTLFGSSDQVDETQSALQLYSTKKRSVVWEHRAKRAELADVLRCHDFGYIYKLLESVELVDEQSDWLVYTNDVVDILQRDVSSLSSEPTHNNIAHLNKIVNYIAKNDPDELVSGSTTSIHAGHLSPHLYYQILQQHKLVNQTSVPLNENEPLNIDSYVPSLSYHPTIHPSVLSGDNFPIATATRKIDDYSGHTSIVTVDMTPAHFTNRLIQSNRIAHTIHHYYLDADDHDGKRSKENVITLTGELPSIPSSAVTVYQPPYIPLVHLDADTALSSFSFLAALHAAGTVIDAVTKVCMGLNLNAFCVVRPPGHHSGPNGIVAPDTKVTTGGEGAPPTSHGFCLINNVAIAAAYAKTHFKNVIKRVAIVDIDVHHGNGTEAIVRSLKPTLHTATISSPEMEHLVDAINVQRRVCRLWNDVSDVDDVMFASVHGYTTDDNWFYPGTGETTPGIVDLINQRNTEPSRIIGDYNPYSTTDAFGAVNEVYEATHPTKARPKELQQFLVRQYHAMIQQGSMLPGTVHNNAPTLTNLMSRNSRVINAGVGQRSKNAWKRVWQHVIIPGIVAHKPDLILVSAGFDAHQRDDMNSGYIGIDEDDYYWITRELVKVANLTCNGRIVSVLEGGYRIHGGLLSPFARSVSAHVRALNEGGSHKWDPHDSSIESQVDLEADRRRSVARMALIRAQQKQRQMEIVRAKSAHSQAHTPRQAPDATATPATIQTTSENSSSSRSDNLSSSTLTEQASGSGDTDTPGGRPSRRARQKVDYSAASKRLNAALANQKKPRTGAAPGAGDTRMASIGQPQSTPTPTTTHTDSNASSTANQMNDNNNPSSP